MQMSAAAVDRFPDSPPLLSVSGLAVRFGALRALDGVDLAVQPGELVALAGENGAGKTTLVRCIAGDIAPASGRILLSGKPVLADPLAVAHQGVAVVWQDLALCDNLDVASNLLLGRENQRQLLAVARAMARKPSLLLLDEPSASLGVQASRRVEELINALRGQGTAILLACHDIDQMFRLADRIVVLRHGRVVADV